MNFMVEDGYLHSCSVTNQDKNIHYPLYCNEKWNNE